MKMFQIVCHCGDGNYGLTISEDDIRWDCGITAEDKESILALKPQRTFLTTFKSGKPYVVRRLS